MNRNEYLDFLKRNLYNYDKQIRDEIIDSFNQHFEDGEAEGKSDEEIIENLGSVEEVMESVKEMYKEENIGNRDNFKKQISSGVGQIMDAVKNLLVDIGSNVSSSFDQEPDDFKGLDINPDITDIVFNTDTVPCDLDVRSGEEMMYSFVTRNSDAVSLRIEERDNRLFFWVENNSDLNHNLSSKLKLEIPAQIRNVYVNTISGDLSINEVELIENVIHSTSGDCEIKNVRGDNLIVKSTSGDIDIKDSEYNNISIQCTSGDVEFDNTTGETLISSTSGDLDINNHLGSVTVETTSGDIEIHMSEAYQISCQTKSGDVDIKIDDNNYIADIQTLSGGIDVNGEYTKIGRGHYQCGNGYYPINISTLSGDISVGD